jgi:hypothetical protein
MDGDDNIRLFRPDMNLARLNKSCERLFLPVAVQSLCAAVLSYELGISWFMSHTTSDTIHAAYHTPTAQQSNSEELLECLKELLRVDKVPQSRMFNHPMGFVQASTTVPAYVLCVYSMCLFACMYVYVCARVRVCRTGFPRATVIRSTSGPPSYPPPYATHMPTVTTVRPSPSDRNYYASALLSTTVSSRG